MPISNASSIALSGLQVETQRVSVSAHNVANANTDGFTPSDVAAQEVPNGGVTGEVLPQRDVLAEARADRSIAEASQTDFATEIVSQVKAVAAYKANLAAIKTDNETKDAALSIKS